MESIDIRDSEVKRWFEQGNIDSSTIHFADDQDSRTNNSEIHLLLVSDLIDKGLKNSLVPGYYQFQKKGSLTRENSYFQWLLSQSQQLLSRACYHKLSETQLLSVANERMIMIDSIKQNGFDEQYPIELLKYRFSTLGYRVLRNKNGTEISFDAYDGHHRVVASYLAGINYVPAVMSHWPRREIKYIERMSIENKWRWYQPIDFGASHSIQFENPNDILHGAKKYYHILRRNLEPIRGYSFLDLGCNTGVISACIASGWASQVVGVDYPLHIQQAWCVAERLWVDYGNLMFRGLDLMNLKSFESLLSNIGEVDCILMSNFVYYLGDKTDDFMSLCSHYAHRIVLQGNHLKQFRGIPSYRLPSIPNYRGEYSTIDHMKQLLDRHGYSVKVDAPDNYSKPVVCGNKRFTQSDPASITKAVARMNEVDEPYFTIARHRLITSLRWIKPRMKNNILQSVLDLGGSKKFGHIFQSAFTNIDYNFISHCVLDMRYDRLPFKENTFDIVCCWETLEHLWHVRKDGIMNWTGIINAWQEMHRVLKPQGVLYLTTTNRFCPRTLSFYKADSIPHIHGSNLTSIGESWGHLREISHWELQKLTEITGCFVKHRIKSVNCYGHVNPGSQIFLEWLEKFEMIIGRKAKQAELYDTLFFVGFKK